MQGIRKSQRCILPFSQGMIEQHIHSLRRICQTSSSLKTEFQISSGIVAARYHHQAESPWDTGCPQNAQVLENLCVVASCQGFVKHRVCGFQVKQHKIDT